MRLRAAVLTLCVAFGAAGCGMFSRAPPPPPPPVAMPPPAPAPQIVIPPQIREAPPVPVAFAIEAAPGANPDATGRASPVIVRVYELKSATGFEAADFFTLFDKEQQAIGAELVGRDEYQLRPGERVLFARPLKPGTRVVGVVAALRDLERSTWRATLALPTAPPHGLSVRVDGRTVRITAN